MDFLKAEIAKKREFLKESKLVGDKQFFKRSALREKEEEEYHAKSKIQRKSDYYVQVASLNKNAEEDLLLKKFEERSREERERSQLMSRKEVVKLLRERNQPIRLFGESDYDTFQRLKRLELLEPEPKGLRNDLIAALDKLDDGDDEAFYTSGRGHSSNNNDDMSQGDQGPANNNELLNPDRLEQMKADLAQFVQLRESTATDDATLTVLAMCRPLDQVKDAKTNKPNVKSNNYSAVAAALAAEEGAEERLKELALDHVLRYLKYLLSVWGEELNRRSKDEKLSYSGKIASATYTQTVDYIKPLLATMQDKCCRDDILGSLVKIIALMMDGNYLKANDAYLELAIGNAPWPLGVTNHGIHSRTAQEKIYAKNVAHVLNDETQRKYIQAIKRLMTQCQKLFPSDPSKSVNYLG